MAIPLMGIFLAGIAGASRRRADLQSSGRRGIALGSLLVLTGLLPMAACGGLAGNGGQPPPVVSVTVSPGSANVYADEAGNTWPAAATEQQFSAIVNNGSSQTVTWAVSGGSGNGTIDATGLYSSPSVAPNPASVTVTATSAEASEPGSAGVNVKTATAVGSYSTIQVSATPAGGSGHADGVTLVVD
jgi:hypothetical protein